ncbi:MAG TPA: CRTAC1 family protein [Pyrinomonadaceae bacterium]|nr:CRTAC1 family protein [Pyrinomonadaceae bacterium]
MRRLLVFTSLIIFVQIAAFAQNSAITFKDVSSESGINVSHISTAENRYIIESMSGGAAVFDCDGDGFLDVATVNGSSVENFKKGGNLFVTLYRQIDGEKSKTPKFVNITASANLTRKGWGMSVTAVDFDGDGILDLFVTGFAGNAVYRGKGACKFEDVTEKTGLKGIGFQTGAAWADYDRDGDLDVFVAGYVSLDLNNLPVFGSSKTCLYKGIRVQCGPRGLPGERDYFYRNKGDGTFEEIAEKTGLADKNKYYGLGVVWADYDNDGWLDLYVANDSSPNYLYKNNRDGTFSDVSFESGTSYSGSGEEQGSMGVGFADYDNDGAPDIFVTNFENEPNTLYRNLGDKGFLDVSAESKVAQPSKPLVGWGTSFVDFDNDGLLDLLVVNGHVYSQMEFLKSETVAGFRQPLLLQRNTGDGKFEDVSVASGLRNLPLFSGRGAAFGDLNNDGLIDVVITNLGDKPTVLLNMTENKNQRVAFKLVQNGKNKDAIGARVTLKTDKRSMIQEVQAGASYLSQNDFRLYFGLGSGEKIQSIEVRWSDGKIETISGVLPNRILTVTHNKGITGASDFSSR